MRQTNCKTCFDSGPVEQRRAVEVGEIGCIHDELTVPTTETHRERRLMARTKLLLRWLRGAGSGVVVVSFAVVVPAQQPQVVEVGGAAAGPVHDVVALT